MAKVVEAESDKKSVGSGVSKAETPEEREARLQAQRLANLTGKGRPKGVPNKITRGIREAVMESIQPGQCHPEGLSGWLRERALGGIEDRKIYAAVVSRVIPIEVTGADGGPVKIDLGWLTGRSVGRQEVDVTPTSHDVIEHNEINRLGTSVPDYQSDEVKHEDD